MQHSHKCPTCGAWWYCSDSECTYGLELDCISCHEAALDQRFDYEMDAIAPEDD